MSDFLNTDPHNQEQPESIPQSFVPQSIEKLTTQDSSEQPPKNNKNRTRKKLSSGLTILIIIALVSVGVGIFSTIFSSRISVPDAAGEIFQINPGSKPYNQPKKIKNDYIAVVHIEGTIETKNKTYDQEWLLNLISDLGSDKRNKGILLYIDSPGGGVYESDEVYLALLDYKTTDKPVWAYMGPLAASGGYYIACAADTIYANRNTLTGSIGVISGTSVDMSALMEKYGIKMTTFTSGRNKNMLNINSPLTAEQKQIMQSVADEAYDQFTHIVAESRKLPIETIHALADGRIYTAQQALKNGLIDNIATFDIASSLMQEAIENMDGVLRSPSIEHFKPKLKTSVYDYLSDIRTFLEKPSSFSDFNQLESLLFNQIKDQPPFPAYYYNQGLIR